MTPNWSASKQFRIWEGDPRLVWPAVSTWQGIDDQVCALSQTGSNRQSVVAARKMYRTCVLGKLVHSCGCGDEVGIRSKNIEAKESAIPLLAEAKMLHGSRRETSFFLMSPCAPRSPARCPPRPIRTASDAAPVILCSYSLCRRRKKSRHWSRRLQSASLRPHGGYWHSPLRFSPGIFLAIRICASHSRNHHYLSLAVGQACTLRRLKAMRRWETFRT